MSSSTIMSSHLSDIKDAVKALKVPFWCAGSMDGLKDHVICDLNRGGGMESVTFPLSDEQMLTITSISKEATFGKGNEDTLDPSYRKALALAVENFLTNFDLAEHGILHTIKTVMMPDAAYITAKLYKLNTYRPGDFFKAHVDTPRGDTMFGSLVVCLPQPHNGGALVVRHDNHEHRFNWAAKSADKIQWGAFYSDCEHEILPVETGHRITLTYNLFAVKPSAPDSGPCLPGFVSKAARLFDSLRSAVASKDFMPKGGKLGFACQHAYPHTHADLYKKVPAMLKGQDAIHYSVLESFGLHVKVMAVWDLTELADRSYGHDDSDGVVPISGGSKYMRVVKLSKLDLHDVNYEGCVDDYMSDFEIDHPDADGRRVAWVTAGGAKKSVQAATPAYGNEPSAELFYSGAAIIAVVPAWDTKEREHLLAKRANK